MQKQKGIFPPQRDPARGGTTFITGIIVIVAAAVVLFGGVFGYQYLIKSEAQNPKSETNSNVQNLNIQIPNKKQSFVNKSKIGDIKIIAPRAGEIIKNGESYKITWSTNNLLRNDSIKLTIAERGGNGQWITPGDSISATQGYYYWTPEATENNQGTPANYTPEKQYLIYITPDDFYDESSRLRGTSDYFKIIK